MKLILSLAFILLLSQTVSADATCGDDIDNEMCVTVQSIELDCNNAPSSNYLSHCIATLAYDVANHSHDDVEAKASCNVEMNYLKSVMGIRDIARQRNSQTHRLPANSNNIFVMPFEFKFTLQAEASNADIKAVNCSIETQP